MNKKEELIRVLSEVRKQMNIRFFHILKETHMVLNGEIQDTTETVPGKFHLGL